MAGSALHPDYLSHRGVRNGERATHVDELDLPDLLHQLHGGVAVDEEGLGVVSQLQRLQPLRHRRGVVAVVADGPHLRGERRRSGMAGLSQFDYFSSLIFRSLSWKTESKTVIQQE